ncbi:GntR family transcriptional regulator/MocR family aminotransferase [Myroides gitamensis]|uniref:MocR-like pyridoxine biosynthesis transcription factor PdxR n=1 Tax=Myroides odoratus TaxID=256 RepID=UPI002169B5C7|nr:PLP-dependent aminotransferase family protein [Myroides odoratus]MCS4238458.1 GntR family transcriptional regulator/MocR family aminotransferase [Myroides odoratus]MDH6600730.1 GntR family transcriptional regulator/MocR family aminotransferase [Myroides gitamensis]
MKRLWKLEIRFDQTADKPIYLQIADAIIDAIQQGRLQKGDILPSTRTLADMLTVNRNTIVKALSVLLDEEWLVSVERKGIYIAQTMPQSRPVKSKTPSATLAAADLQHPAPLVFDNGYPDSKIVPVKELARAYRQIFNRNAKWQMMGYGNALGDPRFIQHIAHMLNHQRGMHVKEDCVCITRGGQMAIYLIAQCLLQKGDAILVENPGYQSAWQAFEHAGATLVPIPVDAEGICVETMRKRLQQNEAIKAVYLTPHHQFPTTVTLSLQRRLEIIQLANQYNITVIEDDYDNEFHYTYRPVLPLCSYPELENYVYIGTLSKVVAPALRVGFLVTSHNSLIEKITQLRKIIDIQGDRIMEQAVLQLIEDGMIKKHIKKATSLYKEKRDFTRQLIQKYLGDRVTFNLPDGGLAFWIKPLYPLDYSLFIQRLAAKGVQLVNPNDYYAPSTTADGLRLSFGTLSTLELERGVRLISECLQEYEP